MTRSNSSYHGPRTIKASEFKATCLKLMDEVAMYGEEIIITKNGRPTARLVACREKPPTLYGIDRGKLEMVGDLVSPLDVDWEVDSDPDRVLNP